MKRILFVLLVLGAAMSSKAQHTVQIDDGTSPGRYGIIQPNPAWPIGTTTFTMPPTGGTIVVAPPPGVPALMWLTDAAGNTLTGGSSSTTVERFGSTNNYDVIMMAFGAEKMRLVSGGGVRIAGLGTGVVHSDASGNLSSSLITNADVAAAAAIAYSKLANTSAGSVLLGRGAGAAGAVQEVTLGVNLSMSGTVLNTTGLALSSEPFITVGNTAGLSAERGIAVNTTLTGTDGGANASYTLSINLANANTWTATQTLPTTLAQGNALIASVNAGTAGGVNANMIGNGLTNAQVNDNLTISGGTVDNSPVGATTPSTGRFTTITGTTLPAASTSTNIVTSNAGALETRTAASLSGLVPVVTNASLTGDGTTGTPLGINLANANTWTATQTLPTTLAQGNALIASVNAGTAGGVNANMIGVGLTNAQVNDNLTISGGTVDNSPVGATTPSTGAFTTLSASGATTLSSFATAGIVHNAAGGLLSSSLIVNADVAAGAAIVDTKLATISTAGKVANSATTATSANTPSTIVLRDGAGDFAANNITAASVTVTGATINRLAFFNGSGVLTTVGPTSPTLNTLGSSLGGQLGVANGGTGLDGSTASAGQLLIGNGAGFSLATLTQGAGITITNGPGAAITIAATGTLSGTGVANRVAFWDGAASLNNNANFTYNGTTVGVTSSTAASSALSVSNSDATGIAATLAAPTTGGIALALASGKMTLSIETIPMPSAAGAAPIPIVGGAVMVVITDNGVDVADKTITFPAGVDGQVLIILNNDVNDKAKTGGGALGPDLDTSAKELGMFIYYAGTWHRMD